MEVKYTLNKILFQIRVLADACLTPESGISFSRFQPQPIFLKAQKNLVKNGFFVSFTCLKNKIILNFVKLMATKKVRQLIQFLSSSLFFVVGLGSGIQDGKKTGTKHLGSATLHRLGTIIIANILCRMAFELNIHLFWHLFFSDIGQISPSTEGS